MKRNTKIVKYLFLVSLLLFTRQAGATGGRDVTIHLPAGILFSEGHVVSHGCVPNEYIPVAPTEADVGGFYDLLFSLYKSVGDLLIQNNAEIYITNSSWYYHYYLTINGKRTKGIEEEDLPSTPNFNRRFFQRINDDVLRRFGGRDKQKIKLEEHQFPADGFTIQMGSFETKKEAVKFKRNLGRELSRSVAKLARKVEIENIDNVEPLDYLFCASCLFQGNLNNETYDLNMDSIEVPEIVLKPYASNDWRVSFGLFIREEDADAAIKTVEKFYNGQAVVQKTKIDKEMIYRQTELFPGGRYGCDLRHSWGR